MRCSEPGCECNWHDCDECGNPTHPDAMWEGVCAECDEVNLDACRNCHEEMRAEYLDDYGNCGACWHHTEWLKRREAKGIQVRFDED